MDKRAEKLTEVMRMAGIPEASDLKYWEKRVCKFLGGFCKKKGGRHHPFSIRKKVVTGFGKCTGFNTFIVADGSAATNFLTVTAMFKVVKTI